MTGTKLKKILSLLSNFFENFIVVRTNHSNRLIFTFAIVMAINFPLYWFAWYFSTPSGYAGTTLRATATIFCIVLALKKYWPKNLLKWVPLYWYFTITFCLPFFFVYMTLKNGSSILWLMNTMSAVFFTLIILDFFSAIIVLTVGSMIAWNIFEFMGEKLVFNPGTVTPFSLFMTIFAAIVIGALFTRIRGIEEDERVKAIITREAITQTKLKDQEEFNRRVNQVFHDINSPITSLRTLETHLSKLPEEKRIPEEYRISLRNAIGRIYDISSNLLHHYRNKNQTEISTFEEKQLCLLSATLLESLSEKRLQYEHQPIEFAYEFTPEGQFAFINVQVSSLKRAVSNLINNAVQALEGKPGVITLKLKADKEWVKIGVQDTGKGMTEKMIKNIMNNIAFTTGKEEGHGIGLGQVNDTLKRNFGTMEIKSRLNEGTQFIIVFPRSTAPLWSIERLEVKIDSIIVVVDDDPSIHGAWDMRFAPIIKEAPILKIQHFEVGQDAIDFINSLDSQDKEKLLLLTDLELLNQNKNGFDIIKETKTKSATLVTSHYSKETIQQEALLTGTKLLPKQLASEIPIFLSEKNDSSTEELKIVDAVWVEDNEELIQIASMFFSKNDKVDIYKNPKEFLQTIHRYSKNTPIFLDNNFDPPFDDFHGLDIAKQLHEAGFTRLFITTGQYFEETEVPDYVKLIRKGAYLNLKEYW